MSLDQKIAHFEKLYGSPTMSFENMVLVNKVLMGLYHKKMWGVCNV